MLMYNKTVCVYVCVWDMLCKWNIQPFALVVWMCTGCKNFPRYPWSHTNVAHWCVIRKQVQCGCAWEKDIIDIIPDTLNTDTLKGIWII